MRDPNAQPTMRDWFSDHALSLVLIVLFLSSWFGQAMTAEGTTAEFLNATFENWQSEFLQILIFIWLSKHLLHIGSPQSKDGFDRLERKVDAIGKYHYGVRGWRHYYADGWDGGRVREHRVSDDQ
jgi:hypothetical protein